MVSKLQNAEFEDDDEDREEASQFSDDDDEDEDGVADEVLQQEPRSDAVYNSVALHEKLEDIAWPDGIDWLQTLSVVHNMEEGEIDVNDDLSREMAFYTQALEGSREAFDRFLKAGGPFLRPPDYYAEMVKSDSHMLKVKGRLLSEQKHIEEAEEHRKAREAKRFSKEVQALKLKQRAQEKKQNIESVKKWRKMRQQSGFSVEDEEFPADFDEDNVKRYKKRKAEPHAPAGYKKFKGSRGELALNRPWMDGPRLPSGIKENGVNKERAFFRDAGGKNKQNTRLPFGGARNGRKAPAPWDRSGGKNSKKAGKGKFSVKRQSRNAKYGHGGKKSFKKANTAESSAGFQRRNRKNRKP